MLQLARIEGHRMLRHPGPWIGLAFTILFGYSGFNDLPYGSAQWENMACVAPLLLGISMAVASAFSREHIALCEDASLERHRVAAARLLGGLGLVALMAGLVVSATILMTNLGGIYLGEPPGVLVGVWYSVPELMQPVVLAGFAVALGAVIGLGLRPRLLASVFLFVYWLLVGTYWLWAGPGLRYLTPLQTQPVSVEVGSANANPSSFPSNWALSAPNEWQSGWHRLIVSPELAAWHDVYVVGLTMVLVAVALGAPRVSRTLAAIGALAIVGGVTMQAIVGP